MSWSLQIQNGDLSLNGAQLGIVTGRQKLVQDLSDWILTKMGKDLLNPDYGSTINGGVLPNGVIARSVIGQPFQTIELEAELQRIANEYQQQQVARSQLDRSFWNKTTLTADEMLLSLDNIDFQQNGDRLSATLVITTAAGNTANVNIVLPGT